MRGCSIAAALGESPRLVAPWTVRMQRTVARMKRIARVPLCAAERIQTEATTGALAFARFVIASASDALLSAREVRVQRIRGDGRCLFRAIARNLAAHEGRSLPEHHEREDADFLRMSAYKVICVDRREEFRSNMIIEGNIDSYCQAMKSPSFYGGEAEMLVLSELIQKPIGVFLSESIGRFRRIIEYGEQFRKRGEKPIRVLYNGSNHYDALLPLR